MTRADRDGTTAEPTVDVPVDHPDPLAAWVERAGLSAGVLQTVTGWLMACFQRDAYAGLEQAGDAGERRVPLARVLVDLEATEKAAHEPPSRFDPDKGVLRCLLSMPARAIHAPSLSPGRSESTAGERGAPANGFVIIGGPGQGKTTLGQLACQVLRAELLNARRETLTEEQRAVLDGFRTEIEQSKEIGRVPRGYLPVQVVLRDFAAWLSAKGAGVAAPSDPSTNFFGFLAEHISKRQPLALTAEQVRALLGHHPWFLVLDGLDEVPPAAVRQDVVRSLEEAIRTLADAGARGTLVATTRPQGYAGELTRLRLAPLHLAPMSLERALHYAGRLIDARYSHDADRADRVKERVKQAAGEETVARLMQTPLHVAILTVLVARLGRAPAERWQLFFRYYSIIYDREVERGGVLSETLAEHRRHIDQVHRRAGLLLQTAAEGGERADSVLTRDQLAALVEQVLSEAGFQREHIQRLIETLLQITSDRLVFLTQREEGRYRFDLRSLQEMMAAWEIVHRSADLAEQRLDVLVPIPGFRNVLLFAASREFSETSDLQGFFVKLCERWNQKETHPLAEATLIGSHLALDLLEEGTVLGHPGFTERLAEIAARLVELPPDEVHGRLAALNLERTEAALQKAIEAALPPTEADPVSIALNGSWIVALALAEEGVAWAQAAAERWWALKEKRKALLSVLQNGDVAAGAWLRDRILDSLEDLPPGCLRWELPVDEERAGELLETIGILLDQAVIAINPVDVLVLPSPGAPPLGHVRLWKAADTDDADWWVSLSSLQDPPPAWRPWVAFARYIQAPTADALAECLRFMAQGFDRAAVSWTIDRLCWPLAACLRNATDGADLLRLADDVSDGKLGDSADWMAAEQRWVKRRILLEEITDHDDSVPWSMADGRPTFPVDAIEAAQAVMYSGGTGSIELANVHLLDGALGRATSRPARATLASLLWSTLASLADHGVPVPEELLEPVRWESWMTSATAGIELDVIALLAPLHQRSTFEDRQRWRRVLRTIGCLPDWSISSRPYSGVRDVLIRQILDAPEAPELWKMLFFAAGTAWLKPDQGLHALRYSGTDPTTMAYYRATQLSLGLVPEPNLSRAVAELTSTSRFQRTPVAHVIEMWNIASTPLSVREATLVGLADTIPAHEWSMHWWIFDSLRELVRRRAAHLDDQETWDRLAFPLPRPGDLFRKTPSAPPAPPSPQIQSIALEGLRLFQRFSLHAAPREDGTGQWLLLLGPNGTGKTTLLRALALSMGDPDIAASLIRTQPSWLPRGSVRGGTCSIETAAGTFSFQIEPADDGGERLRTTATPRDNGPTQPRPVVYAYGCRRGSAAAGQNRPLRWDPLAQIATLFDEEATLIHAETWLQWLKSAAESQGRPEYYKQMVRTVLSVLKDLLPGVESIEIIEGRLWFDGPAVGPVRLDGLSDGYLTMIGWIMDMLARWTQRAVQRGETLPDKFQEQMTGLVLLDEIDLHLHPLWQTEVIRRVREMFPRMTFVVTTHNPLTILGARDGEIFVLRRNGPDVAVGQVNLRKGAHADQILTGPWFGLDSTVDFETQGLVEEHRRLLRVRRRSPAQEARREELESILRDRLMTYADTSTERLAQSIAAEIILAREEADKKAWKDRAESERQAIREEIKQRVLEEERGGSDPSSGGQPA